MIPKTLFLASVSLALFAGTSARAQTILTSATQPTPGANDISSFTNPFGAFNGQQDYSNNNPAPGETFTTTGAASSFRLNSVTVQGNNNAGPVGGVTYQNATYTLTLYSVAAGNATALQSSTYTFPGAPNATDSYQASYLTFNLATPLTLAANTQYAYAITANGGFYGFAGSGVAGGIKTTGGQAVGVDPTFGGVTNYAYSRNFDIGLTAVPEPGTWAMLSAGGLVGFLLLGKRRAR